MLKTPFEIVDDILDALQANDCPAVNQHIDDFQEALVARLMAGDFASQSSAYTKILTLVREQKNLGADALSAFLARVGVDNRTAFRIIDAHDEPLVNEAVCDNLIKHKPPSVEGHVRDMGLAMFWLASGDYEIFNRFATSLLDKPCDKPDLQHTIVNELFGRLGDHQEIYQNWVARNQDRIIALSQGGVENFKSIALHRGIKLFDDHLQKLAMLVVTHSDQSPNRSDLYDMRTKLGVVMPPERLQQVWAGNWKSPGWSESSLQAVISYHLAFADSPQPLAIGGQDTEATSALVQAMYFLKEQNIDPIPEHMGQILDVLLTNLENEDVLEDGLKILKRSEFRRHFMVNTLFRDNNFGADLGL
ncbi:hypothetical protein IFT48_02090 [Pseudomonas fluorescens]|uniref:hypothetical protein n=1 Tax=Pseudomonas fluorescens TaxID=294 RepID=UPI001930B67E|nr:hypothetical protein [Pseudomonas fluorescens]MBD8088753.1 hypothetical protein [Pseudomonas fluorescens]